MSPSAARPLDFQEIQLLIYDLDGTLVDAFMDIWMGVNAALASQGLAALDLATVKQHVGDGARRLIERCVASSAASTDASLVNTVYAAFMHYYENHPAEAVTPYEGAHETLAALRALGYKQAILTNKPHSISQPLCERLGLADCVDGIWGEQPGRAIKPEAEAIRQIARHFGLKTDQCAMVGDGPADFGAARAAGTAMIAVTYGQMSLEKIEAANPDAVINRLGDLVGLFFVP